MSPATARPLGRARSDQRPPPEELVVSAAVLLTVLLGAVLLVASLVPTATLAGRLVAVAGDGHAGTYTQELLVHFGQRLRFAAMWLLVLGGGLVLVRAPFAQMLAATLRARPRHLLWLDHQAAPSVGVVTLVALAARLAFINQPMRYDEALTFNEFASRPLYYGLSFYPDPNNHLLNTLLMHLAFVVLGNQPWVLRLPALLGGVLLAPATYALGRGLYGARSALVATVLVAVSSYLVEYSTNGRGYTLQATCFVTMLALVGAAVRRDSPALLLFATLVAAVGAYALPTMLYGVCVAAAWVALEARRRRLRRIRAGHLAVSGLVLVLAVVVLYLPVIVISGPDKLAGNRFVVPLAVDELVRELPRSLARTWGFWNRDIPLAVSVTLVVGFVLRVARDVRARQVSLGLLAPAICLGLVLAQRVAPFERVWLFLLPLYFVIAAGGLVLFVDWRLLSSAFAIVIGFFSLTSGSILTSGETGVFPDAQAVASALRDRLGSRDAVATTLPASLPELQYYFPRVGLSTRALVRDPQAADHLYVVAPGGTTPAVAGWTDPREVQRLSASVIFELERVQP